MELTRPEALTDRQWEVYQHVVQGKSYQEIADELGVEKRTVDFHCQRIRTRLGLKGKPQRSIMAHALQERFPMT